MSEELFDRLQEINHHSCFAIEFSPNNKYLAASSHRKIMIYDSESLELKNTLQGHKDSVVDISFSSCSKYLASASNDKNVMLWDPERKKPEEKKNNLIIKTEEVQKSQDEVPIKDDQDLQHEQNPEEEQQPEEEQKPEDEIKAEKSQILNDFQQNLNQIEDLNQQYLQKHDLHQDDIFTVSISFDFTHIASGSRDETVQIYSIKDKIRFKQLKLNCFIMVVKYTKCGFLIVGGRNQNILIYDQNYNQINEIQHKANIWQSICFDQSADRIVTCHLNQIKVWNIRDLNQIQLENTKDLTSGTNFLQYHPNSQYLIIFDTKRPSNVQVLGNDLQEQLNFNLQFQIRKACFNSNGQKWAICSYEEEKINVYTLKSLTKAKEGQIEKEFVKIDNYMTVEQKQ